GGREWVAHATMLLLTLAAIFATVRLALRLGLSARSAALAGVFLAATPVVLGMAVTAMPDVPAMTLAVAALERLWAWRADRRLHQLLASALLLALAPLARSHLLLLYAVGALLLWERP